MPRSGGPDKLSIYLSRRAPLRKSAGNPYRNPLPGISNMDRPPRPASPTTSGRLSEQRRAGCGASRHPKTSRMLADLAARGLPDGITDLVVSGCGRRRSRGGSGPLRSWSPDRLSCLPVALGLIGPTRGRHHSVAGRILRTTPPSGSAMSRLPSGSRLTRAWLAGPERIWTTPPWGPSWRRPASEVK